MVAPTSDRCSVTVQAPASPLASGGGTGTLAIDTTRDCQWTATTDASWVTISTKSGQGAGSVPFSVAANRSTAARRGTISVNGRSVDVMQDAATCDVTVSPTQGRASAGGGDLQASVTAPDFCTWTVTRDVDWISITSPPNGAGNAEVTLHVSANVGTTRSGTAHIAGRVFTVDQEAAPPGCTFSISPTSTSASAVGTTVSVTVNAAAGCPWSAIAEDPWITIVSGASGTGSGTAVLQIGSNSGPARSGSATIAGVLFSIAQDAAAPSCNYTVTPTSANIATAGGSAAISITAGPSCAWSAFSSESWLAATPANGAGSGTVTITAQANPGGARTGTVIVAGRPITISQAAVPAVTCSYSVAPASFTAPVGGGSTSVTLTTSDQCAWAITDLPSWISASVASGSGSGSVSLTVEGNSGAARSATISIGGQSFAVSQPAAPASTCSYTLAPTSANPPAEGASVSVAVTTTNGCAWSVTGAPSWISVSGSGPGSGNAVLNVSANSGAARSVTLTIAGKSFLVSQAAAAAPTCSYTLAPPSANPPASGASITVAVTTANGCAWSVTGAPSWITVSGSGPGPGNAVLTVAANAGAARSATLTIAGQSFVVSQDAAAAPTCNYSLSPTSANPPSGGGPVTVSVTTANGCAWSVTGAPSWITVSGSGPGPGDTVLTVAANSGAARSATLTIAGQSFVVSQAAAPTCTFSIAPTSFNPSNTAASQTVTVTAGSGCAWTTTGAPSWVTVTNGSGTGNGSVTVAVQANTGPARSATLTIAGKSFVITQAAAPSCAYTIAPTSYDAPSDASAVTVNVTTTASCAWTTTGAPSWITVSGGSGSGNGSVSLNIAANTGAPRSANLSIAGQSFAVTQAQACSFAVSPLLISGNGKDQDKNITITTAPGCAWTAAVTDGSSWLTITSAASGTGNGTVKVHLDRNLTGSARSGALQVAGQTVTVQQDPN